MLFNLSHFPDAISFRMKVKLVLVLYLCHVVLLRMQQQRSTNRYEVRIKDEVMTTRNESDLTLKLECLSVEGPPTASQ